MLRPDRRTNHLLPALAAPLLIAGLASAQSPAEIEITGIVRDFKESHVDMNVSPVGGSGHYAGNVALGLASGRPALLGTGARVSTQWLEQSGSPIAPHLYIVGGGGGSNDVLVAQGPQTSNSPTIDSFDSSLGPYGGSNVGPAPNFLTGSPMPPISPPGGMPYIDKFERSGGRVTISSSFECKEFIIKDEAVIEISGDVVIRANEKVDIINKCRIHIPDGSSLELWADKDFQITDHSQVNVDSADPTRFKIYYWAGNGNTFKLQNQVDVYAQVFSPLADLLLQDASELYGVFEGKRLLLQNHGGYHHDGGGGAVTVCGNTVNDTGGAWATPSTGGIDSSGSFQEWFEDYLGVNLSVYHKIRLRNNGSGVYEYHDDAFYPLDNRLFGNEGAAHNYYFTFSFAAYFTYTQCAEQFFEFEGADDCWVFIDDQLALDLGGVLPGTNQVIPIDRLGLVDGQTYQLRLFYAQRQGSQARFHVRTNLQLDSSPFDAVASAGFD